MESISDFWKSARERLTNPFAFAYVVAWFTYNWRVTVALFFTDNLPTAYKNVFSFISDQIDIDVVWGWPLIKGFDVYLVPFFLAIAYILLITFFRQVVGLLNVEFDKIGTMLMIKRSEGGKVPVEKYLTARKNVVKISKELDKLYEQETEKDRNFMLVQSNLETLQSKFRQSQDSVNNLQASLNEQTKLATDGQSALSELPAVKKALEDMERNYYEQLEITEKMRDPRVFNGLWKANASDKKGAREYEVMINNGTYTTPSMAVRMNDFFYDHRNGQMCFNTGGPALLTTVLVLTFENDEYVSGKEGNHAISYTRIGDVRENYQVKNYTPNFIKETRGDV